MRRLHKAKSRQRRNPTEIFLPFQPAAAAADPPYAIRFETGKLGRFRKREGRTAISSGIGPIQPRRNGGPATYNGEPDIEQPAKRGQPESAYPLRSTISARYCETCYFRADV